jgi:hypothetical protein
VLVADTKLQRNWRYIFQMATLFTICLFSPPSFILSRANNSFSFYHCVIIGILSRLFAPDSIYKKCMIPTTSPFEVREEHVIHIHSSCFVKAYLYVVTISSIYVEGFVVLCLMLKYASDKKTHDMQYTRQ